ncbi:MAG: endospore germination permease [Clostridia bacterium]|nr:endospore germination permease [Clostridia bacterium]MDD4146205.1 endospore germination permease [Clostridia bacterium]MDD4665625.1 endospore germination permease [Clostridia bacterium]
MKKELVGHSEAAAFIIIMIGAKAFLGYPRIVTEWGLTAGWLVVLLSGLISIVFWLMIVGVLGRFPGKPLSEIAEVTLGPVLGLGINTFVFLYSIFGTSNHLRLFSEAAILTVLTETPVIILALIFVLTAWLAAYYGIEALFRSAYFSFPFLAIGVALVLLVLYPYYDFKMLLPLTGPGVWPVIKSSFWGTSAFGEVIILAYLVRYFSFKPERLKNVGVFSLSFVMMFFIAITGVYLMVLPVPASSETLVPFYQLSRSIFLGHYFQRVEAVFVIFWTFTAFISIAAGILVGAIILQDTFKLPSYRPLLPALCLLTFSLAFTPLDLIQTVKLEGEVRMSYGWIPTFVLPLLIWAAALILRKGENKTNDS